ncbi:hypothetical protein [Micromonospora zhanjiangensis]|uniref:Uncharacterized protein n=1 Tax=Micromonospora zhanjiangensis TaxID=1522057 RepID=A0ABV8KXV8_9ACTN
MATGWTTSDAWVFSAIAGDSTDDGRTLSQVVARADGINHALLTEAEFTRAVRRLTASRLVEARPETDRYRPTEAGRELYRQRMRRRGLFGWIDVIPAALRRLGEPGDSDWSLTPGVFDRATQQYLHHGTAAAGSG